MKNWYKKYKESKESPLFKELNSLKRNIVESSQLIYNEWDQDNDGFDFQYGCGGICDHIANSILDIIYSNINDIQADFGSQLGDDHEWVFVKRGEEVFGIDIYPYYYEVGSGYCWKKRPNVTFTENMIDIFPIDNMDNDIFEE